MKTVLFLGAGATRAQWDWEKEHGKLNPDIGKDCLPHFEPAIGKDFVELARCHCLCDWPKVKEYRSDAESLGVEDLFTLVYQAAMDPEGDASGKAAWHHLLVCYRKLVGCSTKALTCPAGSPLPELLNVISRGSEISIVTTNQDFAVEFCMKRSDGSVAQDGTTGAGGISRAHALRAREVAQDGTTGAGGIKREHGPTNSGSRKYYKFNLDIDSLTGQSTPYALEFQEGIVRRKAKRGETLRKLPLDVTVPILKIHGSLNWWYASASEVDPAPNWPEKPPYLMTDADIPVLASVEWDNPPEPYLYPLIVPFVRDKSDFFKSAIASVREEAIKHFAECDTLIVFGYGFSEADSEVNNLFTKATLKHVEQVVNINPAQESSTWLNDELGLKVDRYCCIENYIAHRA